MTRPFRRAALRLLALLLPAFAAAPAAAAQATAAVAANFVVPMRALVRRLHASTGHEVEVVAGATGRLVAQIVHGAPFDLLLAADQQAPAQLEAQGLVVPGSRFTYASGRLVLWSAQPGLVDPAGEVLRGGRLRKLAIANPKLAPYGAAALEVLERLGLADALAPALVRGESVAQTFTFVATGNADAGFVALAQLVDGAHPGSRWVVPASLHAPIRQDAVLLRRGADNPAARALLALLRSPEGQALVRAHGYAP